MAANDERGLEHVIWIARREWSLMQRGELPMSVEKELDNGKRLVVAVVADSQGRPHVQAAWIERRTFLARSERGEDLPEGTVMVRLGDD